MWRCSAIVLMIVLAVPLVLILALYRYELRLVSRWAACGTLTLRLLILLVILFAVGVQPQVAQESIEPIHVGQGDAEVAAVFPGPHLEAENLRIARARPECVTTAAP